VRTVEMAEFEYIRWLRQRTPADPRVLVGPGDDCAVLRPSSAALLVNTDMLLENSHFILVQAGPRRVGRKALAVNLSDIAAVGGSILGKHLEFTPRIREALELQEHAAIHAMLDISDGLAADVNHLCEESQCGAVLVAERIPISLAAYQLRDGHTPLQHALGDGEDFELA